MQPSFSFELPTQRVQHVEEFVRGDAVAELSAAAESAGFAAVNVSEHPAPDARWLDGGGHHALDPFVALSFAAAATRRVRLLTNMLVIPYRNPFLCAKSVQSLQLLSGNRFILGAAVGYLKPEFAALGVDFDERNELFDESLEAMKAVWSGEDTLFKGRHFEAAAVRHVPACAPQPPIWIGGNSIRAIRRAVSHFDGWAPFGGAGYGKAARTASIGSVEDLRSRISLARESADELGRTEPLDICYSALRLADPTVDVEKRRDQIGQLSEAGVTWLAVSVPGESRSEVLDGISAFSESFIGETTT